MLGVQKLWNKPQVLVIQKLVLSVVKTEMENEENYSLDILVSQTGRLRTRLVLASPLLMYRSETWTIVDKGTSGSISKVQLAEIKFSRRLK